MKFQIVHENKGRMRVHLFYEKLSFAQADTLDYYLNQQEGIQNVKVMDRTADIILEYQIERNQIISLLQAMCFENIELPEGVLENSGRALNQEYQEKLVGKIVFHYVRKWFFPLPFNWVYSWVKTIQYVAKGISCLAQRKIEVPVLDATAIGVSMIRGDREVASSIMFMLGIGELLEDWTHKKSVDDLARSMSLNISKVWLEEMGQERLVPTDLIKAQDRIVVHMGNVIPFDGTVVHGEAMVNQASLTGESVAVIKNLDSSVYAGTVVEEGEITIQVKEVSGSSRFEKIVKMIEESEKLKSGVESKAEHLADKLVPYSLLGTGITYLLTRNVTRALSILMVDYSCALKLAMPISVLSAIKEASTYHLTVKGGKYLEAMAEAKTIVFDKTGTLTKAQPKVVDVISFSEKEPKELLRIAACLEEHFPHSIAKAVVDEAAKQGLEHEEMHSKIEYIVAHGIASTLANKRVVIGSYHFVFEDEKCVIPHGEEEKFKALPLDYSHLYLAIDQCLEGVLCIEDPLKEEAYHIVESLKDVGFEKVVMMTGDSERTAALIAQKVGVDEYYSEVLPEDKANFILAEKSRGRKVVMIGDGINDSPALSNADVGIAISEGAEIAREIADITIASESLNQLVTLKMLSDGLMQRIHQNYISIVGFNSGLILLGVTGLIAPTTSAMLHNTSTLFIGLKSMKKIIE